MSTTEMARPVVILLIEDDPADVRLTREAMKEARLRHEMHVAIDGEQALAFLHRTAGFEDAPHPSLILLDLNLPRKSGLEVLEDIKADDNLKTIPVVVLTTSDADNDALASYRLQANCVVVKPVDLDQFLDVMVQIEHFWLFVARLPPRHLP
jgi:chemotaxis family two-component system response regulator Rcp1